MTNHSESVDPIEDPAEGSLEGPGTDPVTQPVVTLRTPAELADALPYLLGFRPESSVVLIALHGRSGRFGGRARLGIPTRAEDWPAVAEQLAQCLVSGCERREARPDGVVAFLCQEPGGSAGDTSGQSGRGVAGGAFEDSGRGEDAFRNSERGEAGTAPANSGRQVVERLRPLAQALRTACGSLDVPVLEVVCISDGRFWTYCCPDQRCCPAEGTRMLPTGTSVLAAATAYSGRLVGLDQGKLRARLTPWRTEAAAAQESALHGAAIALLPRILDEGGHDEVADETIDLARRVMARLAEAPVKGDPLDADLQDDELLAHDEAAALILGIQDRTTRDRAAEWMEGAEAKPALRLWRALARRCVGPFHEHAAAPLTLAGWVAWSLGDLIEGQEALTMALKADPHYTFALLLHPACGADEDPEPIRRILRGERAERESEEPEVPLVPEGFIDLEAPIDAEASIDSEPPAPAPFDGLGADRGAALEEVPELLGGSELPETTDRLSTAAPAPAGASLSTPAAAASAATAAGAGADAGAGVSSDAGPDVVAAAEPRADAGVGSASPACRRASRSTGRARPGGAAGTGPRHRRPSARRDTRNRR
ncbi:DUF4192 domain-containing protein [Streptomyces flavofungini]|uniref:DUF4192 domain-containing protein n=1 Tax=Streptomyces flavofungini TaxID=68200 RepID=UPI0025AFB03A|nr:DUF4192 domain-containing protein [Streptomyces flavofungini]WJV45722.1 DUF4192 domain-containing protein [Streptomyces flavofungini]